MVGEAVEAVSTNATTLVAAAVAVAAEAVVVAAQGDTRVAAVTREVPVGGATNKGPIRMAAGGEAGATGAMIEAALEVRLPRGCL